MHQACTKICTINSSKQSRPSPLVVQQSGDRKGGRGRPGRRLTKSTMRHYSSGGRGPPTDSVSENNKIVFIALGGLFGVALFLFIMHIVCVKCMLKRFSSPAMGPDDADGSNATRRRFQFGASGEDENANSHLGLDKAVVDLLPTFVFTNDGSSSFKDVEDCAVCLAEFEEQDRGRILPNCNHYFHVDCIDMWFLSHSSCPLCRREVLSPSGFWGFGQLSRSRSCPVSYANNMERLQQLHNQPSTTTGVPSATPESIFTVFGDPNLFIEEHEGEGFPSSNSSSDSSFELSGLTSITVTDESTTADMDDAGNGRPLTSCTPTVEDDYRNDVFSRIDEGNDLRRTEIQSAAAVASSSWLPSPPDQPPG